MSKQINIGFSDTEKIGTIKKYLEDNKHIDKVVYFTENKRNPLEIDFPDVEYRTWDDAIMYRYFYPLLEKIDHSTLLIFDEMMRTKKRSDLTYNCCHHYGNQTKDILVFEYFPMIDEKSDFMILVDFAFPNVYKGQPYDDKYLKLPEVTIKNQMIEIGQVTLDVSDEMKEQYDDEKEMLFDNIGNKDPDTIPRTLHIWCGTHCKKEYVKDAADTFLARNSRFKSKDVYKWTDNRRASSILDFPVRQLQFNDYCKNSGVHRFNFINSTLSADNYYFNHYTAWTQRLGEMYVTASI